jgi:hypothetical protein
MDMSTNTIRVETEEKDENGEPIVTFVVDENGQFVDNISKIIFRVAEMKPQEIQPQP